MKYTAYENRIGTDKFFTPADGSTAYTGYAADSIGYIENAQLLDPALWALFVEQFRIGNVDDHDNGWRGEYWGKMMRGACFTYAYTQNDELYKVLEDSVRDLISTQDKFGRIACYSVTKEFHGWDLWSRKYVMLGFQYFLEICKDGGLADEIIAVMCRHADYILEKIGSEGVSKIPITNTSEWWKGLNSSSILEPFVRLYNLTKEQRYLDFAADIIKTGGIQGFDLFNAALEDELYPYQYPITKAYEMISNFEGIVEYYRVTGEEKYKKMAVNFARRVIDSDITVIGSAGTTHELFDHSKVRQFDPKFDGIMQETCVTVTWMKFCYQLLCLTGDSVYADQIERSIYNALMGAINVNGHVCMGQVFNFDSYSPLLNSHRGRAIGGRKDIIKKLFYWGCCVAIGAAGTGMIAMTANMKADDGIAANLYIPGKAEFAVDDMKVNLTTETSYPADGEVKITVCPEREAKFAMYVRIPEWSVCTVLKVNGEAVEAKAGTYARIERVWNKGDVIELSLDMRVKIIRASELDPNADAESICHAALQRGPVMLARDAQFGEDICEAVELCDENGYAKAEKCDNDSFISKQCYKISTKSGTFKAADYASCGQTWDPEKIMTVWVTTK